MNKIKYYEDLIKNAKDKEEIKKIVRLLFKDDVDIDDITFSEFIYQDIIPKLKEFNIFWDYDIDNKIDYEEILKENY